VVEILEEYFLIQLQHLEMVHNYFQHHHQIHQVFHHEIEILHHLLL
jgi:hypothetical protein